MSEPELVPQPTTKAPTVEGTLKLPPQSLPPMGGQVNGSIVDNMIAKRSADSKAKKSAPTPKIAEEWSASMLGIADEIAQARVMIGTPNVTQKTMEPKIARIIDLAQRLDSHVTNIPKSEMPDYAAFQPAAEHLAQAAEDFKSQLAKLAIVATKMMDAVHGIFLHNHFAVPHTDSKAVDAAPTKTGLDNAIKKAFATASGHAHTLAGGLPGQNAKDEFAITKAMANDALGMILDLDPAKRTAYSGQASDFTTDAAAAAAMLPADMTEAEKAELPKIASSLVDHTK